MHQPIACEYVGWGQIHRLCHKLARQIIDSGYRIDTLVAVGRGGYPAARLLSDLLGILDLTEFKIERYHGIHRAPEAVVRYPLTADLKGKRVLLVDDISDSGDTFDLAIGHIKEHGPPAELRTAVIHHKTSSSYVPDYYPAKIVKWRWIVYPWAITEDLGVLLQGMEPRPQGEAQVAERLLQDHGLRLPRDYLQQALDMLAASYARPL
ncbi:MAG: phosphoribosyltransferase [Gammaproteobacteria bacterium]|nr:phosphoribosyltransferase [Gammaproteobacteria bacterium]MBU1654773.1 phosphoribosyltransferase [Gammaproteobacteria bacterium]MBU1960129.1 phosphoribosyltransferase [Gammaproteobacteria bacterium]